MRAIRKLALQPALVRPHPLLGMLPDPGFELSINGRRDRPDVFVGIVRPRHFQLLERDLEPQFPADADAAANAQPRSGAPGKPAGAFVANTI